MKRRLIRAATFILLAALPLGLGGCIFVGHPRGGGYCYYHRC